MLIVEEVTIEQELIFNNLRKFLNRYSNSKRYHTSEYKIPDDARIFVKFKENEPQSWDSIQGAAAIYNWCSDTDTADITFITVDARAFFSREMTYYIYYYLFDFIGLRVVYSPVPESDTRSIYNLRNFGYNELFIPQKMSDEEGEYLFYLRQKTWKDKENLFNGKNAKIKRAANNWIAHQEQLVDYQNPPSIPLEDHWGAVPENIREIALHLPESKRDDLYNIISKGDQDDQQSIT